jgi:hypothetical protein
VRGLGAGFCLDLDLSSSGGGGGDFLHGKIWSKDRVASSTEYGGGRLSALGNARDTKATRAAPGTTLRPRLIGSKARSPRFCHLRRPEPLPSAINVAPGPEGRDPVLEDIPSSVWLNFTRAKPLRTVLPPILLTNGQRLRELFSLQ